MELFYQAGPDLIKSIKSRGHDIFLDLKLHDIPNTVEKAMEGLGKLDVDLVNVHAAGGTDMMKAAVRGLHKYVMIKDHCCDAINIYNRRNAT